MARHRLGAVLLLPQPLATEVDGIRRALGDGALARIDPHCTLVPPVNVANRDLPTALEVLRSAAADVEPLHLVLGPLAAFHPVSDVAYLAVAGAPGQLDALHGLREGLLSGPLHRESDHPFEPHVTVCDRIGHERGEQAIAAMTDLSLDVTVDRVHLLEQGTDRRWRPIADAPLGHPPVAIGRGSLPLELAVSGRPDPQAAALLATDAPAPGLPWALTGRNGAAVVAAAWGWSAGERLEVADLAVAAVHRGRGVGRHLVTAIEDLARRRSCTVAGMSAPGGGAPAALLSGCGWVSAGEPDGTGARRWERRLGTAP
jgi:2'-5' RNA ligase